jgi:DNA-binding transcriptional ArsR family regulator
MATKQKQAVRRGGKNAGKQQNQQVSTPVDIDFSSYELTRAFATFGDETRGKILAALAKGKSMIVSAIVAETGMTQPTVSHHLGIMRAARVVDSTRDGKSVIYSANADTIKQMKAALAAL